MQFAGEAAQLGCALDGEQADLGQPACHHSHAHKRGSDDRSKHMAAGVKKGRAAFGDITNSQSQNEGTTKDASSNGGQLAVAVPSTTTTDACEVHSPAPTPSYLIKRIRFSDKFEQQPTWVDIDEKSPEPLACSAYINSTFHNLKVAETKKRPSPTYMDTVQNDINPSMRSILVDWLVEVAAEYRLHSDTLFLTVSYLDRYLSVAAVQRSELQLVGVTCMLVASKYEEIYAPTVEDFCYITDHTYARDALLATEGAVLGTLRFELSTPTVKTFLRRFLKAAAAECVPDRNLELLACYLSELSLLDYGMLKFLPSQIAAAAVLVALCLLKCEPCWSPTLSHYTGYEPRNLRRPAQELHALFVRAHAANAPPAVKEKYDHEKLAAAALDLDTLPDRLFH